MTESRRPAREKGHVRPRHEFSDFRDRQATPRVRGLLGCEVLRQRVQQDTLYSFSRLEKAGEGALCAHGQRQPGGGGDPPLLYGKEAFIYYFVFIHGVYVYKEGAIPIRTDPSPPTKCTQEAEPTGAGLSTKFTHTLDLT